MLRKAKQRIGLVGVTALAFAITPLRPVGAQGARSSAFLPLEDSAYAAIDALM
jgi:hypothetical protein